VIDREKSTVIADDARNTAPFLSSLSSLPPGFASFHSSSSNCLTDAATTAALPPGHTPVAPARASNSINTTQIESISSEPPVTPLAPNTFLSEPGRPGVVLGPNPPLDTPSNPSLDKPLNPFLDPMSDEASDEDEAAVQTTTDNATQVWASSVWTTYDSGGSLDIPAVKGGPTNRQAVAVFRKCPARDQGPGVPVGNRGAHIPCLARVASSRSAAPAQYTHMHMHTLTHTHTHSCGCRRSPAGCVSHWAPRRRQVGHGRRLPCSLLPPRKTAER
jgi:hypothetical protein